MSLLLMTKPMNISFWRELILLVFLATAAQEWLMDSALDLVIFLGFFKGLIWVACTDSQELQEIDQVKYHLADALIKYIKMHIPI